MKIIKEYNNFINENIDTKFKLKVKFSHGDADFNTEETYKFKTESDMLNVLNFLYKIRNFIPKRGYENLGYYSPITGNNGYPGPETLFDENTWDKYSYYISKDKRYNQGYASIKSIILKINNEKHIILDVNAAETNLIELPKLNDIVEIDVNHISGYGSSLFDKNEKYLPNLGRKDYKVQKFNAKVIDCKIRYSKYMYGGISSFSYILLCKTDEKVLLNNDDVFLCTIDKYGWDKNFEVKYNKDKFDGLKIYEYKSNFKF